MGKFAVGDVVWFDLSRSHGGSPDSGTVIGHTFPDVCVVADEQAHGMPINEAHCKLVGNDPNARRYRERYESMYPPMLPEPSHDNR